MFRALFCSTSGGQNCITQHLLSSYFVGRRPVHRTATYICDDTRCCIIQLWPTDDEQNSAPNIFFFNATTCPFVDFVVLPPRHGRCVTDFWGWDAHEAQFRCPDGVWVVIEEDVVAGEALTLHSTNLPRQWSPRECSPSRKIPTLKLGIEPGTSWLIVRDSDH
jgi:hypothetical protein